MGPSNNIERSVQNCDIQKNIREKLSESQMGKIKHQSMLGL